MTQIFVASVNQSASSSVLCHENPIAWIHLADTTMWMCSHSPKKDLASFMFISTVCTGTQNVERRVWKTSHFFDLQLFRLLPLRTSALVIVCNRKSGYHHVRCIVSCLLFESVCVAGWGIHLCRFKCRQSSQWRGIASQDSWSCGSMFFRVWVPIVLHDIQNCLRTGIVKVTVTPTWAA